MVDALYVRKTLAVSPGISVCRYLDFLLKKRDKKSESVRGFKKFLKLGSPLVEGGGGQAVKERIAAGLGLLLEALEVLPHLVVDLDAVDIADRILAEKVKEDVVLVLQVLTREKNNEIRGWPRKSAREGIFISSFSFLLLLPPFGWNTY